MHITTVTFVSDPSHGWGLVTKHQLAHARMTENDISKFSYCTPNREIYALEEDVDLPKFIHKLESMGDKVEIVDNPPFDENHRDNPRRWEYVHNG